MQKINRFGWTLFPLLLLACSGTTSHYTLGQRAIRQQDYKNAIAQLKQAVRENPLNMVAVRDLGIAFLENSETSNGVYFLEKALQRIPTDGMTIFYLGKAYEQLHRLEDAITVYKHYTDIPAWDPKRGAIAVQLDQAVDTLLRQQARQALRNEANIDVESIPPNTVAVVDFRFLGNNDALAPLRKGLAEMILTDLSQVNRLEMVERVRLENLLTEMGLGMSGLVDAATAPRIGRLVGASKVVYGSVLELQDENLRIDAGLTDTKTFQVQVAGTVSGKMERLFRLEKNLVFRILDDMKVQITEDERKAILTIPTENLLAFLAYCRGLDAEDHGDLTQAETNYQMATKQDPKFKKASQRLQKVRNHLQFSMPPPVLRRMVYTMKTRPLRRRSERLYRSAVNAAAGFGPLNANKLRQAVLRRSDVREPTLENSSDFGIVGEIRIEIPLPPQ